MNDLDTGAIERELDRLGARLGRPLSVVAETGSTNDDARRAAAAGVPHGAAFLADAQSAGRGRGGHAWHSPAGENLYLSVVLRPRLSAASVAPVTLAIGLAVARVAERCIPGHGELGLKWPNDVYSRPLGAGGRGREKLAGVLVEGQLRGDTVASLVAGVGINVRTAHFPPELVGRATSLKLLGASELDRSRIAAALLAEVGCVVAGFEAERLVPFLDELGRRDVLRGERVEVGGIQGTGAGIDTEGRLLVRVDGGEVVAVASGEVVWGR